MLHGLTLLALSAASTVPARPTPILSAIAPEAECREGAGEEAVVCGRREDERYRLPFRDEAVANHELPIGEQSRLARDPFTDGPCGIFEGQRKCDKAEARLHGLGGGNDPISFARKLGEHLVNPDD